MTTPDPNFMMTMTISIVSPELDAIFAADDDALEKYTDAAIDAAREYLVRMMPDFAHHVAFDNVTMQPATSEHTACHEIECSIEP